VKIRKCFSVSSYSQIEKLLESKKTKTILIIYIKSNLIKGFGIDWLRVLINLIKKNYKQFKIKFYVDSGTDYGLSILIIRENIDYLKLRSNRIILNKINQMAKKNKVVLNPNFNVVDLSKIKNFRKLKI
tara:strand:+ start:246 stop:632 length:387 start_codon:yes stop_codon:yes gene_type:complete